MSKRAGLAELERGARRKFRAHIFRSHPPNVTRRHAAAVAGAPAASRAPAPAAAVALAKCRAAE